MWEKLNRAGIAVSDPESCAAEEQRAKALAEQRAFSSVDMFAIDSVDAGGGAMDLAASGHARHYHR